MRRICACGKSQPSTKQHDIGFSTFPNRKVCIEFTFAYADWLNWANCNCDQYFCLVMQKKQKTVLRQKATEWILQMRPRKPANVTNFVCVKAWIMLDRKMGTIQSMERKKATIGKYYSKLINLFISWAHFRAMNSFAGHWFNCFLISFISDRTVIAWNVVTKPIRFAAVAVISIVRKNVKKATGWSTNATVSQCRKSPHKSINEIFESNKNWYEMNRCLICTKFTFQQIGAGQIDATFSCG